MRQFNTLKQLPILNEFKVYRQAKNSANLIWQSVAPSNLATLCSAINIKNQQLNLITEHNSVAAKVKLLIPSLLKTKSLQEHEIIAIQIKVQVQSKPPIQVKPVKKISAHAAANLTELANQLEDSPLRKILVNLAAKAE